MRKLSDYVEMAATEYLQETGREDLDAVWAAEFFEDCCMQDGHPRVDLIEFYSLVQKALTLKVESAQKLERLQQEKSVHPITFQRKPPS